MSGLHYSFGPTVDKGRFNVSTFAPGKGNVEFWNDGTTNPMEMDEHGFWKTSVGLDTFGSRYGFILDGRGPFPDPGGRFMPDGIDGLSQLLDTGNYDWAATGWNGLPLDEYVIGEIHVGAFTDAGTYSAMEEKLDHLSDLGITAVEIMPVAQFYGTRNWGYDGVYLYSPQNSYGSPGELLHLVDAIHSRGMCAILDVVYNHSGPVGNYLDEFAPFHHLDFRNTWGNCFNLDGEFSGPIREYILQNAIYWLREFRFDALRLDAVHGIIDQSPVHILKEMAGRVRQLEKETGRRIILIAESDRNDSSLTRAVEKCGTGIDAQWNDDFHHAVHTALTGEHKGYYMDYGGNGDICKTMNSGFLYSGQYSRYLKRNRGTPWSNSNEKLVVCSQNHDQVGNRAMGERLITLAGREKARLAALLTLLSPFTPLLFMGEEMGEESPFLYFIQTEDTKFANSVYRGRLEEFKRFDWISGTPDPSSERTFTESKIKWGNLGNVKSGEFLALYRELIRIRRNFIVHRRGEIACEMATDNNIMRISYGRDLLISASLNSKETVMPITSREWTVALDTSWKQFGGEGEHRQINAGSYNMMPYSGAVFISQESASP